MKKNRHQQRHQKNETNKQQNNNNNNTLTETRIKTTNQRTNQLTNQPTNKWTNTKLDNYTNEKKQGLHIFLKLSSIGICLARNTQLHVLHVSRIYHFIIQKFQNIFVSFRTLVIYLSNNTKHFCTQNVLKAGHMYLSLSDILFPSIFFSSLQRREPPKLVITSPRLKPSSPTKVTKGANPLKNSVSFPPITSRTDELIPHGTYLTRYDWLFSFILPW